MSTKYGEQIARIDERTLAIQKNQQTIIDHLETLNGSQETQWKAIRGNEGDIKALKERQGVFALIQGGFAILVAGIAGWFGAQR